MGGGPGPVGAQGPPGMSMAGPHGAAHPTGLPPAPPGHMQHHPMLAAHAPPPHHAPPSTSATSGPPAPAPSPQAASGPPSAGQTPPHGQNQPPPGSSNGAQSSSPMQGALPAPGPDNLNALQRAIDSMEEKGLQEDPRYSQLLALRARSNSQDPNKQGLFNNNQLSQLKWVLLLLKFVFINCF